jgi:hypothetical protein
LTSTGLYNVISKKIGVFIAAIRTYIQADWYLFGTNVEYKSL